MMICMTTVTYIHSSLHDQVARKEQNVWETCARNSRKASW